MEVLLIILGESQDPCGSVLDFCREDSFGAIVQSFTWKQKWFVTLGLAKESFTMSRHGDHIQWLSFSAAVGNAIWRELRGENPLARELL